jgi:hypothetical protein
LTLSAGFDEISTSCPLAFALLFAAVYFLYQSALYQGLVPPLRYPL